MLLFLFFKLCKSFAWAPAVTWRCLCFPHTCWGKTPSRTSSDPVSLPAVHTFDLAFDAQQQLLPYLQKKGLSHLPTYPPLALQHTDAVVNPFVEQGFYLFIFLTQIVRSAWVAVMVEYLIRRDANTQYPWPSCSTVRWNSSTIKSKIIKNIH